MKNYSYCFIVNPISGAHRNPQQIVGWIEKYFSASPHEYSVRNTDGPGDATRIAAEEVKKKTDIVVAVGGDGTINEIGRGLLHSETAMGIIPAGSGNGFARNFKIPLNQEKAVQALLQPNWLKIDAGKINEHYFFNVAGSGLDAEISLAFDRFGTRGPLPYFWLGAKSYFRFKPQPAKIQFDDREIVTKPMVISIANAAEYGNGAVIAPGADPHDGLLDLIIIQPIPLWRGAATVLRLFRGSLNKIPQYQQYRIRKVRIEFQQNGPIHTDGNPFPAGNILNIEVLPAALSIIVPHR